MSNDSENDEPGLDLSGDEPSGASTRKAGRTGDVELPGDEDPRSSGGTGG